MKRTWLISSLLLAMGLGLLSGFVGSAEQGVLEFWADDKRAPILSELAPQIEEQLGIPVNVTELPFADIKPNFINAAPAGEGPDIIGGAPHDQIGELIVSGLLEPIELTDSQRAQFTGSALDAFTFNGQLYGLPYAVEAIVLFYNKDLVPEAPASFEALLETARTLMAEGKVEAGITWDVNNFYFSFPFLSAQGGYVFGKDEQGNLNPCDIGLDNEGAIKGAEFIASLIAQGLVPSGLDYNTALGLFKEGKTAFHINGPWILGELRQAGMNFGAVPIPTINGQPPRPFLGVQGFLVSAFADDKTVAMAFLTDVFATLETQKFFYERDQRVPAFLPLLNDPIVQADQALAAVGEAASVAIPMPNIPEMGAVWSPMGDALTLITTGQQDPATALKNAVATIKGQIDCPMASY